VGFIVKVGNGAAGNPEQTLVAEFFNPVFEAIHSIIAK
jgi:hypothetical protein